MSDKRDPLVTPEIVAEYISRVQREGAAFAELLRDASDAGVSHMLILPQLVLVFREAFGEMPPDMAAAIAQAQGELPPDMAAAIAQAQGELPQ